MIIALRRINYQNSQSCFSRLLPIAESSSDYLLQLLAEAKKLRLENGNLENQTLIIFRSKFLASISYLMGFQIVQTNIFVTLLLAALSSPWNFFTSPNLGLAV